MTLEVEASSGKELDTFTKKTFEKYNLDCPQIETNGIRWFRTIYWKLDVYSCVYVPRNKMWFSKAFPKMKETWDLIEHELSDPNAYEKYKPKSKEKKENKDTKTNEIIEL